MTDERQRATMVKCKREESLTKQSIYFVEYLSSLEESFEFSCSSLADEHKTLPISTRRHVKLNKFIFKTPWLLDLLCKHWFASSVWNFCSQVADVPPREKSPAAKSEEKRMFSHAKSLKKVPLSRWASPYWSLCGVPCGIKRAIRDWSKSIGWVGQSRKGVGHEVLSLVQGVGRAIFSYP